jgi:hypothetical protein
VFLARIMFFFTILPFIEPGSSGGTSMGYGLEGRGSIFLYSTELRQDLTPTQPIQYVLGALSPGVEAAGT